MSRPCDFPLYLRGVLTQSGDVPERKDLLTGYTYLVRGAFTCPLTNIVFKVGDMVFWDVTYSLGTWRVIRANIPDIVPT
jgi:hypothetical protein